MTGVVFDAAVVAFTAAVAGDGDIIAKKVDTA